MKISIITLFPGMIQGFIGESIIKRAVEKGVAEIEIINLREFATDAYGTVDDRPYGGGAGMVLKIEPVSKALAMSLAGDAVGIARKTVVTSPRGRTFTQTVAREYAALEHLVIFAGHYEGIDERAIERFDEEVSLGDFVMTGGEIAAAAMVDSIVRLLPGALKKVGATDNESFFQVKLDALMKVVWEAPELRALADQEKDTVTLLEYPHYTRPDTYEGSTVPEVLLNGNHKDIEAWRLRMAFEVTRVKRPDLLK